MLKNCKIKTHEKELYSTSRPGPPKVPWPPLWVALIMKLRSVPVKRPRRTSIWEPLC